MDKGIVESTATALAGNILAVSLLMLLVEKKLISSQDSVELLERAQLALETFQAQAGHAQPAYQSARQILEILIQDFRQIAIESRNEPRD